MDNIQKRVAEVLNDPERLKQISDIASAMGIPENNSNHSFDQVPIDTILEQASQILQQVQTKESRQQTLVQALLPYLNPQRKNRLERAMQVLQISKLAETALQSQFQFSKQGDEALNV